MKRTKADAVNPPFMFTIKSGGQDLRGKVTTAVARNLSLRERRHLVQSHSERALTEQETNS